MRDFTLRAYRDLCTTVLSKYPVITVREYLKNQPETCAIFRHDVDKRPQNALEMAKLENLLGLRSTYYFRTVKDFFDPEVILKIHELGHEVGYHYEVLDTASGDFENAINLFEDNLHRFPCEVDTICMHGNPLTPWDNRDLWSRYDFKNFGLIGEAYLSLDFSKIAYFSDTGRAWHNRYSVKDFTRGKPVDTTIVNSTSDLIRHIPEMNYPVCIVTHPQRWNDAVIPWVTELSGQKVKNIGKAGIRYFKRLHGIARY